MGNLAVFATSWFMCAWKMSVFCTNIQWGWDVQTNTISCLRLVNYRGQNQMGREPVFFSTRGETSHSWNPFSIWRWIDKSKWEWEFCCLLSGTIVSIFGFPPELLGARGSGLFGSEEPGNDTFRPFSPKVTSWGWNRLMLPPFPPICCFKPQHTHCFVVLQLYLPVFG